MLNMLKTGMSAEGKRKKTKNRISIQMVLGQQKQNTQFFPDTVQ